MATYRYQCMECGTTYIGPQLPGRMQCNCTPPRQIQGVKVVRPLSDELLRVISIGEASTLRSTLCTRWNIDNKSHRTHGANFSGNQKVVSLIMNIVAPVTGQMRAIVRQSVIDDYGYDIDTREMV